VWIPSLLRDLTAGQETIEVPGTWLGEVLGELERRYPGIKARLCEGEGLRPGLAVVIGSEFSQMGLSQPLLPDSEVHFVPAVAGG